MNALVKPILKDPNSLTIYEIRYQYNENIGDIYMVDYGAANSFGGMVRDVAVFINGSYYDSESSNGSRCINLYWASAKTVQ